MFESILEALDIGVYGEELPDVFSLSFWESIPLAVLRDDEPASVKDTDETSGAHVIDVDVRWC